MTSPRLLSRCLVTFSVVPLVAAVTTAAPSTSAVRAITGLGTAACDPVQTPATVRDDVPTAQRVLGFPLGRRDVTAAESDTYLGAVDRASPRVTSGTLATSVRGRPLRYAVVGQPENVTPAGLARVRRNTAALRDPRTPARQVKRLAASTPAILWVTGNVHGDEKSGTDGALRTLYELAARTDCAARRILDNAVVVLLPMQNPDGRQAGTRQNASGFDMNRDWFARTQPETDGKVELMRKLPPVLFIDAHEMGGKSYFFPPNADPIYHEISGESVDWINNLFGKSMATEFTRQKLPFFNRDVYDLFYLGYGDTVPATGWNAAGMTFEKGGDDSTPRRVYQQYLTQWVSLSAAAGQRRQVLTGWHTAYQDAYQQGRAGRLEPNEIVNPGNDLVTQEGYSGEFRVFFSACRGE
jgi:Zinc carboxypeptidase